MLTRFQLLIMVVGCFFLLVCGLAGLVCPQAVRNWGLKGAAREWGPISNPFLAWMRGSAIGENLVDSNCRYDPISSSSWT